MVDLLLEVINAGAEPETLFERYREAQRRAEETRRAAFRPLVADPEDPCPATSVYHDHSRLFHGSAPHLTADEARELACDVDYKSYPQAPRVPLARAWLDTELGRTLAARRSVRRFGTQAVPQAFLATCLGAGCGVTEPGDTPPRRAIPSAGALYPVEVYAAVFDVEGVDPGLYHYEVLGHVLERLRAVQGPEEIWPLLGRTLQGVRPGLALLLTARLDRARQKYTERAYRFALLECGHLAQNVSLLATAAGLASVPVGGFVDDEMNRFLGVDGRQELGLYLVLIGAPR